MSEKVTPMFLPPSYTQDPQQFRVKDTNIYIGRNQLHGSTSLCCRCLMVIVVLVLFGIGAVILAPKLAMLTTTVIVVDRPAVPCRDPSGIDRTTVVPGTSTASNSIATPNSTVLYSMKNPANVLSSYMQIATLYTANDYWTTLTFVLGNVVGHTYLDDVSVTDIFGKELLRNGNFESGSSGWTNFEVHNYYQYLHNGSTCHGVHSGNQANLSQTFWTTPGSVLNISFLLRWDLSGTGISHQVIVWP